DPSTRRRSPPCTRPTPTTCRGSTRRRAPRSAPASSSRPTPSTSRPRLPPRASTRDRDRRRPRSHESSGAERGAVGRVLVGKPRRVGRRRRPSSTPPCIASDSFWVFPHPDLLELAVGRWPAIAEGLNPERLADVPGLPPAKQAQRRDRRAPLAPGVVV